MTAIDTTAYGEKQLKKVREDYIKRNPTPGKIIIHGDKNYQDNGPKCIRVHIGPFQFNLPECKEPKQYGFVEHGKRRWKNGFVELRTLGKLKYMIRVDAFPNWHIGNIEDEEISIQYFLRMTNK